MMITFIGFGMPPGSSLTTPVLHSEIGEDNQSIIYSIIGSIEMEVTDLELVIMAKEE